MCVSEAYNEQKKITIIANNSNDFVYPIYNITHRQIDVILPKGMLENIVVTIDGKKSPTFMTSSAYSTPRITDPTLK